MNNEILLVDDSSLSNEIVKVYIENLTDFVTVVPISGDDALEKYKNSSYAYTIIDNNKEISTKLMSYILDSKVKSNVILLSDGVYCPADCSFCVKNYSFIRLMKPLSPNDVLTYITIQMRKKSVLISTTLTLLIAWINYMK